MEGGMKAETSAFIPTGMNQGGVERGQSPLHHLKIKKNERKYSNEGRNKPRNEAYGDIHLNIGVNHMRGRPRLGPFSNHMGRRPSWIIKIGAEGPMALWAIRPLRPRRSHCGVATNLSRRLNGGRRPYLIKKGL